MVSESSLRDLEAERFEKRGERGTVRRPGVKRRELLLLCETFVIDNPPETSESAGRLLRRDVDSRGLTGTVSLLQLRLDEDSACTREAFFEVLKRARAPTPLCEEAVLRDSLDCDAALPTLVRRIVLRGVV
jgi:hypothetical protein